MTSVESQETWDSVAENWDGVNENWDSLTTFVIVPRGRSSRKAEDYNFWLKKIQSDIDERKIRLIMTTPANQENLFSELKLRHRAAKLILLEMKTVQSERTFRKLIIENIHMSEVKRTLNE